MSRTRATDERQGNAGSLGKWLLNPRNREKMYKHDREAAADLARMREEEERTADRNNTPKR